MHQQLNALLIYQINYIIASVFLYFFKKIKNFLYLLFIKIKCNNFNVVKTIIC